MTSDTVLLLDPRAARLRDLSHRLTAAGYEVVPVADAAKAVRFAAGLGSAVVVIAAAALGDPPAAAAPSAPATDPAASLLAGLAAPGRTLVVLGDRAEDEERVPEHAETSETREPPETIAFLAVGGLDGDEVARRLGVVLLGRGLGLAPDAQLASLVGDLAQRPLIELLRALRTAQTSGRVELRAGSIALSRGAVTAAAAGPVRGLKAFCRLGRLHEGPLRFVPAAAPGGDPASEESADADLAEDLDGLILAAIEDSLGEPRPAVQVVTDSTADLPPDVAREHGIAVFPLTVAFGREVFRDRVDLQPGRFYELLRQRKEHPVSSPPPPAEMAPRYRAWLDKGAEVVSIHLSAKLSQTWANASAAAAPQAPQSPQTPQTPQTPQITVLDSRQVSLGLGLLAVFAARLAARGETAERIVSRLGQMAPRVHTLFVVDTLEFLARGGRIGKARALLGGLLRVKPILGLVDGEVTALAQARGGRAAQPRLLELLRERVDPREPLVAGISHADAPAWAERLAGLLRAGFAVAELIAAEVGPVVGAHAGPGVVALSAFQPTAEERPWIAPLA